MADEDFIDYSVEQNSDYPDDTSSSNIEKKTKLNQRSKSDPDAAQRQQVVQTGGKNVLNGYRSATYNFTFAGLKKEFLKDPDALRASELDLVILKSGGKGYTGIRSGEFNFTYSENPGIGATAAEARTARSAFANQDPRRLDLSDSQKSETPLGRNYYQERATAAGVAAAETFNQMSSVVEGFNKNSPGRFDMYIDNVEVESLMAFSTDSNVSLPTKIKFEVIEPYSINGFLEALYVTAIAAGYPSYMSAPYLLKVEFKGYKDDDVDELAGPVLIPNSQRYFPILITQVEVDITEQGTRYRIEAVPTNEKAFGQTNVLAKSVKMEGMTVNEILTNLIKNVNIQTLDSWKQSSTTAKDDEANTYHIKFQDWSETEGWIGTTNKFSESKVSELYKDNALYMLADPASVDKSNGYKAYDAKSITKEQLASQPVQIQYSPTKTVIQFPENMNIHDIISSVIRDSEYLRNLINSVNPDQYGMVDYFLIKIETTDKDVINTMSKKFAQDITYVVTPYKIHYTKIPNLSDSIIDESELKKQSLREYNYIYTGQNVDVISFKLNFNTLFFEAIPAGMGNKNTPDSRTGAGNEGNVTAKENPTSAATIAADPNGATPKQFVPTPTQSYSGNASQPLDDPYSVLARGMHDSIVNSKASMITGEMEILGDPFYLATGGLGNYNPKPSGRGMVAEGELNKNYGSALITINFRNPIDIQPLEDGGTMFFDSNRVPFSGVYQVTQVNHSFKQGNFKQRLQFIRVPGQVLNSNLRATDPTSVLKSTPEDNSQIAAESIVSQQGTRIPAVSAGALSSIIGQSPTDITSALRLNVAGLTALTNLATNVITGNVSLKQAASIVGGQLIGSGLSSILNRANIGSGIGEGALVNITNSSVTDPTALDIKFEETFNSVKDAPPYTGSDPIVRSRLGLPPVNDLDDGDFS